MSIHEKNSHIFKNFKLAVSNKLCSFHYFSTQNKPTSKLISMKPQLSTFENVCILFKAVRKTKMFTSG